jgi:hypothetical protein
LAASNEQPSSPDTPDIELSVESSGTGRRLGPPLAVGGAVVGAFAAYAVLAQLAAAPRFFDDELIYWKAAASLAAGHGLEVRGKPYGLGLAALYPAVLAPILSAVSDREHAYALAKTLNALLFSLSAIPVYLTARRVLRPWPSAGAAALSIAIPSAMYVSVVMTESLAYLAASWALFATLLALERPSPLRQVIVLLVILVACTARLQLVVLVPAYLLALAVVLVLRRRELRLRALVTQFWPTAAVLLLGLVVVGILSLLRGTEGAGVLGRYTALWVSYDVTDVARQLVYHLANLDLYLAVVPLAVSPIVLSSFVRRDGPGSSRFDGFVALFLGANAAFLLLAAALDSSKYSLDRLHDRYVFYVVPLWLIVLFAWGQEGAPRRPRAAVFVGASSALLLSAVYPVSRLDVHEGGRLFDGVATTFWAAVRDAAGDHDSYVRAAIVVFTILVLALAFLPRRRPGLAVALVVWILLGNLALVWSIGIRDARANQTTVFGGSGSVRRWVDERLPAHARATTIFSPYCGGANVPRKSLYQTEFFNSAVDQAVHFQQGYSFSLASSPFRVAGNGSLALPSGAPLVAEYVIAQPGVRIVGRRLGQATRARLVLWSVHGRVRVSGARSALDVARQGCRGARS